MCHIRGFGILLKSQLFVIQTWASCYANTPHSFEHDRTSTEDAAMLMWNLEPKWKKDQKGKKMQFFFYYHFITKLWKGFRNYKASLFRGIKIKWTIESVVGSQSQFPFRLQRVYSGKISRPINDLMYSETERTYWRKKICMSTKENTLDGRGILSKVEGGKQTKQTLQD